MNVSAVTGLELGKLQIAAPPAPDFLPLLPFQTQPGGCLLAVEQQPDVCLVRQDACVFSLTGSSEIYLKLPLCTANSALYFHESGLQTVKKPHDFYACWESVSL